MQRYSIVIFLILVFSLLESRAQDSSNYCLKTSSFHIVVIGSSTASGAGASTYDSAWVNRYRNFVQSINSTNSVTNLAIGGTNTYHIMPSWFVAPSNRPTHNSNNVTQAISLGADAIIVNMPSNDAASGYGVNEQLFNFHTIVQYADSFNVPVWVCTTQPKANFPLSKDSIQVAVKDSVLSAFGNFALDFWTTLALANNKLDSNYDSGDGTHLNDAGHRLLFERVQAKNILSFLYNPSITTDFVMVDLGFLPSNSCGDTITKLRAIVSNIGPQSSINIPITAEVYDQTLNQTYYLYDTITGGLNTCEADTIEFVFNTWNGANLKVRTYLQSNDLFPDNDTSQFTTLYQAGRPSILSYQDTVCMGDVAHLQAISDDNVFWYGSKTQTAALATGFNFYTPNLSQSTTYWVEAIREPLHYPASLQASNTSNINLNGVMFNIIAKDTLVIDSISFSSPDSGLQVIMAQYHMGGYIGYENNANAWTFWGVDALQLTNAGAIYFADFGSLTLYPNDTLGVYLSMFNANARLSYQSGSSSTIFSSPEMDIICGSGISYNLNSVYPNRKWKGGVYYHYGYNPKGKCTSRRMPMEAFVDIPNVDLGMDTVSQFLNSTLNLDAGPGFSHYLWSTGDTTQIISLVLDSNWLNNNSVMVQVESRHGCINTDIVVIQVLTTDIPEIEQESLTLFPNPAQDVVYLQLSENYAYASAIINIYNALGEQIKTFNKIEFQTNIALPIQDLTNGMYWVEIISTDDKRVLKKLLISK